MSGASARRRAHFRTRLEHGGADRGGASAATSPRRSRWCSPTRRRGAGLSLRARPASRPKSCASKRYADRDAFEAALQARLAAHDIESRLSRRLHAHPQPGRSSSAGAGGCSTSIPRCCPSCVGLHTHERALAAGLTRARLHRSFRRAGTRRRPDRRPGARAGSCRTTTPSVSPRAFSPRSTGSIRARSPKWRRRSRACAAARRAAPRQRAAPARRSRPVGEEAVLSHKLSQGGRECGKSAADAARPGSPAPAVGASPAAKGARRSKTMKVRNARRRQWRGRI